MTDTYPQPEVPSLCKVPGCVREAKHRNLCDAHRQRLNLHGDVRADVPLRTAFATRDGALRWLKQAVGAAEPSSCIEWPGNQRNWYGRLTVNGERVYAHRLALELHEGPPPADGMQALHAPGICHNPICVNPHHLRWGTPAENAADKAIDGTQPLGERSAVSKLTARQVLEIVEDPRPQAQIANDYGIDQTNVSHIKRGSTWSHVTGIRAA